jgi:hypothetical protein
VAEFSSRISDNKVMCSDSLELSGNFTVATARGGGVVLLVVCDASYLWDGRDLGVEVMRGLD